MTEEYDEEVVFENSPLFQYLQDLGHTDFEACPTVSQEEEPCAGGGEGPFPQEEPCLSRDGLFWSLADALWRQSFFHQGGVAEHQEQQLDADFRQYSLRTILEQDVFLQEDLELIELLDPGVLSVASASSLPAAPPRNRLLPSAWALWTLAVVVAVLAGLRSVWDGRGLSALVPWALALGGFLLIRGAGLWRAARLSGAMRAHGAQLESLAQDSQVLTALIRKALRLIQETEVISRGFTLLLDRVSAACPFNRAENQLLGLRRASYQTLHTAFRAYRHATRRMLSAYPLDSETDDAGNYLCTAPLGELGLGLGEGRPSDQRAQELTDDYGLPALKVLFQLFVGQSSEFFRRLALLLSPGREGRDARLARRAIAEVTGPLRLALCGCLGDLQRSYDFHRCFEAPPGERERRRRGREESRPVLLELKSVLRLRASEGERQRWKQLLLREEAAARTTLPMEPSEPRGNSNRPEPYSQQNNHEGPAPCSTEARLCRGRSEGVRARPAPRSPSACGSARAGGGAEGGSERDRAPPGGQSLYAVCDGQTDGPPQHSNHQHGGADLRG